MAIAALSMDGDRDRLFAGCPRRGARARRGDPLRRGPRAAPRPRRRPHRRHRLVDPAARRARRRNARRRAADRDGAGDAAALLRASRAPHQHRAPSTEHPAPRTQHHPLPPADDDRRRVRGQQPARAGDADAVRRRAGTAPLPVLLALIGVFAAGILVSMSLFGVALAGVLSTRALARVGHGAGALVGVSSVAPRRRLGRHGLIDLQLSALSSRSNLDLRLSALTHAL